MTAVKKSLALFLAVILAFSSLSVGAFALELSYYTVETYFMDTKGKYPSVPDSTEHRYEVIGSTVVPEAADYEGFTFDTDKSDGSVFIEEDGTSVAKIYYSRNQYTLTYVYEDLLGPQTEETPVYFGAELPSFEANPSGKPAKQGYTFIMWSTDPDERAEAPLTMPASDIDLYPIYEIKTYTFTFDAIDGAFSNGESILTQEYKYGEAVVKPEEPTKNNYVFVDWDADVPDVAEKNMDFFALYNEVTYFVAFFDGEEEKYFEDGYYYGDYFEDVDVPEGYEAWTLFDGTYVTFPYEIKGNTVFYAAPAPAEYTAKFYLEIEDTEPYATYTGFSGSSIEFPEEPSKIGYKFVSWTSDVSVMPDEDVDFIAEWEPIEYTITFDTDGGSEIAPETYYYENEVTVPEMPEKDGYVFMGWEPEIPDKMPAENITVTAQWEKTVKDDYLGIKTVLYTYDETVGDWVPADEVERGEKVKARFFLETGFAVSDGQIMFFFNNDAFTCDYVGTPELELNPSPTSTAGQYYINGNYTSPSKNHHTFTELVEEGYITEEFLDNHTPVTLTFYFADFIFRKISGEEWFAEFELTAREDAVGTGDFFVVPETIQSEDRYYAYIGFSRGVEGDSMLNGDYDSMFDWTASINIESNPVSTGYGRITADAGEGCFSSSDARMMSFDFAVGEPVFIENPVREGYLFAGYEPELPDVMSDEVLYVSALWVPCDDTSYRIIAHYTDFSSGEAVEAIEEFVREGTTNTVVKIVEELPAYPDDYTDYILLEEFGFEYNVFDFSAENIFETVIIPNGSGVLEIYFKPATYNVIFNANGGEFDDGSTVKSVEASHGALAMNVAPYNAPYKYGFTFVCWSNLDETTGIEGDVVFDAVWRVNVHTLTLIVDGNEYTEDYEFGSTIDSGVVAEKEGHTFLRWEDENGIEYAYLPEVMPDESLTLTAVFEKNEYTVTFDDGTNVTEEKYFYDDEITAPENPEREGYSFAGWLDENGKPVRDFGKVPAKNIEFKADWIPDKYNAVFSANEGEFSDGSNEMIVVCEYDETIFAPDEQPVRDGYIFYGWQDAEGNFYNPDDNLGKMPLDGKNFEAIWYPEINSYTVSFEVVGDCRPDGFVLPDAFTADEGEIVNMPSIPSFEGYEFDGWYYNGVICKEFVMPSADVMISCRWIEVIEETTTQPTTTKPVVTEPTTVKPTTTKPVVTEPTTVKPTTTKPVVTEPTTVKPTTTKPVVTEPTTVKPTTTKPVVTEPTTVKPTTTKPVVTEPTTVKPTTTKPVETEPTTVKPTTTKPVETEPTTVKPTTTKPVVTEPTTVKPTTTKPVETEPTTKPTEPVTKPTTQPGLVKFEIRTPSVTTITYGDSIILHADYEGELPEGAKIEWTIDNGNFKLVSTSADRTTCTITPEAKGDSVITATVLDKDGNVIGSDTQTMTSKAGFFQKIVAFFKKLFGMTKIYPEIFKSVFEK